MTNTEIKIMQTFRHHLIGSDTVSEAICKTVQEFTEEAERKGWSADLVATIGEAVIDTVMRAMNKFAASLT